MSDESRGACDEVERLLFNRSIGICDKVGRSRFDGSREVCDEVERFCIIAIDGDRGFGKEVGTELLRGSRRAKI